jgi:hypothetical protein
MKKKNNNRKQNDKTVDKIKKQMGFYSHHWQPQNNPLTCNARKNIILKLIKLRNG